MHQSHLFFARWIGYWQTVKPGFHQRRKHKRKNDKLVLPAIKMQCACAYSCVKAVFTIK